MKKMRWFSILCLIVYLCSGSYVGYAANEYKYTPSGELQEIRESTGKVTSLKYDLNGNRTKFKEQYDSVLKNFEFENQASGYSANWNKWEPTNGVYNTSNGYSGLGQKLEAFSSSNGTFGIAQTYPLTAKSGDIVRISFLVKGDIPNYVYLMKSNRQNLNITKDLQVIPIGSEWKKVEAEVWVSDEDRYGVLIAYDVRGSQKNMQGIIDNVILITLSNVMLNPGFDLFQNRIGENWLPWGDEANGQLEIVPGFTGNGQKITSSNRSISALGVQQRQTLKGRSNSILRISFMVTGDKPNYVYVMKQGGGNIRLDKYITYIAKSNGWMEGQAELLITESDSYGLLIGYDTRTDKVDKQGIIDNIFMTTLPNSIRNSGFDLVAGGAAVEWRSYGTASSGKLATTSGFHGNGLQMSLFANTDSIFGVQQVYPLDVKSGQTVNLSFMFKGDPPNYIYIMRSAGGNVPVTSNTTYLDLDDGWKLGRARIEASSNGSYGALVAFYNRTDGKGRTAVLDNIYLYAY